MSEPSLIMIPEGTSPEAIFEKIVTDHAKSYGITPDRIEWQNITSPQVGVFLVPITGHKEGPMRVAMLLSKDGQ